MTNKTKIVQLPLTTDKAKQIIRELATYHSSKILLGTHSKERMNERGITRKQIFDVLKSKHNTITERPTETPKGSWKLNIQGVASGIRIEIVIDLRNADVAHANTSAFVITVILK